MDGPVASIHMPREYARLFLRVTSVRLERVQSITEEDARAEGVTPEPGETYRDAFARVWRGIYGAASWEWNSYVWACTYAVERVQ